MHAPIGDYLLSDVDYKIIRRHHLAAWWNGNVTVIKCNLPKLDGLGNGVYTTDVQIKRRFNWVTTMQKIVGVI